MNAACTKQQIAGGVTNDSPEIFYQDTMKGGHNLNNPALLKTLTENARYAEEWLVSASARAAVAVSPLRAVTAPVTAPPSGLKFFAF